MTTALVFPGQGSQSVGMGKALAEAFPAAREVFEEVDDALAQKLSKLMREGPEALTLTENAQPALMAVSMAVVRALESEAGFRFAQRGGLRRRPFARRIFGAVRRGRADAGRHRAAAARCAARRCSAPFRSARARWRRCSGSISAPRRASRPRPRRRYRTGASARRQRQRRRPRRDLRHESRGRAGDRARQAAGASARFR